MKHGFEIPFPSFTISVSLTWKLQFLTFLPCDPVAEVLSQRQELQCQVKRLSIWLSQSLSSCSRHGETDTSTICSTTRTQTTCYKLIYFRTPIMLKAFSPLIILPSSEKSCLTVTSRSTLMPGSLPELPCQLEASIAPYGLLLMLFHRQLFLYPFPLKNSRSNAEEGPRLYSFIVPASSQFLAERKHPKNIS